MTKKVCRARLGQDDSRSPIPGPHRLCATCDEGPCAFELIGIPKGMSEVQAEDYPGTFPRKVLKTEPNTTMRAFLEGSALEPDQVERDSIAEDAAAIGRGLPYPLDTQRREDMADGVEGLIVTLGGLMLRQATAAERVAAALEDIAETQRAEMHRMQNR